MGGGTSALGGSISPSGAKAHTPTPVGKAPPSTLASRWAESGAQT